jgi:hypothetical protein
MAPDERQSSTQGTFHVASSLGFGIGAFFLTMNLTEWMTA